MAILKHIAALSLLAATLSGCEEEFNPRLEADPVLCINSLISAGKPVEVSVSRTRLFSENISGTDFSVNDATVSVYANGQLQNSDYIAAEGDRVRIVAESPTFGNAEAEVTVPVAAPIKAIKFTPSRVEMWKSDNDAYGMLAHISFNVNVELEVVDNPDSDNYFNITHLATVPNVATTSGEYQWNYGSLDYESEPIFSEHIGVFESITGGDSFGFTFFTDRQFQDKSYTLHLQFSNCSYYVGSQEWDPELLDCGYMFILHTISKSYYYWNNYLWQRENGITEDLGNIGLGEPVWGYSNVSTGAGVVAAESQTSCTISLSDFLEQTILDATDGIYSSTSYVADRVR